MFFANIIIIIIMVVSELLRLTSEEIKLSHAYIHFNSVQILWLVYILARIFFKVKKPDIDIPSHLHSFDAHPSVVLSRVFFVLFCVH